MEGVRWCRSVGPARTFWRFNRSWRLWAASWGDRRRSGRCRSSRRSSRPRPFCYWSYITNPSNMYLFTPLFISITLYPFINLPYVGRRLRRIRVRPLLQLTSHTPRPPPPSGDHVWSQKLRYLHEGTLLHPAKLIKSTPNNKQNPLVTPHLPIINQNWPNLALIR